MSSTQTDRQTVIGRAVEFLDATDTSTLTRLLVVAGAREEYRQQPGLLRDVLATAAPDQPGFLGAYQAALRLLHAANVPTH